MCRIDGKLKILVHQSILLLMISFPQSGLGFVLTEMWVAVDTFSLKHVPLVIHFLNKNRFSGLGRKVGAIHKRAQM